MDMYNDIDEGVTRIYENGHWLWDEKNHELLFKSDVIEVSNAAPITTAILDALEFKENVDLDEQQGFRKRIQRRCNKANDVVTLQDIKDVVLFTAPFKIVRPGLIHLLHLPATERLLRALIFFCQYHLQISESMNLRTLELLTKVRTSDSEKTELNFRENLEDIRLLVAKEYSNLLTGAGELAKYHHMGLLKKSRSVSKRESILFETFVRISVQIIWIALGRRSFSQIELEIHRIFKTPIFNSAEHKLTKAKKNKMNAATANERGVLRGHCIQKKHKVNMMSPLLCEMHCSRDIDHQIYGLGIVKYPSLNSRLRYMEHVLILPEERFHEYDISLGILGLPRARFDILLKEILLASGSSLNDSISKTAAKSGSRASKMQGGRNANSAAAIYRDIVLPPRKHSQMFDIPAEFPRESIPRKPCSLIQRQKWMQSYLLKASKLRTGKAY